MAAALALIGGGVLSFLPVLGLWMLPLGLALLSEDIPALKPRLEALARAVERAVSRFRKP
ncbi:protein of unassigned function [Methylobacterium oryzae CBMB20]|uniref:Protein of unassigned function n=1 Tax=Methylobacterium oryzae CBMB20 TaxID=693986 RepID=A0A089NW51_9HYPH|nr:protein of unassigned function [Methylobacterium oryzae CBMB20]